MATGSNVGWDYPFKAAGSLANAQYHGVYPSANDTVNLPSGAVSPCGGVLQNKPAAAGRGATVRIAGQTKIACGGTLTAGQVFSMAASGWFTKTVSGSQPAGLCIKGANSGYPGEGLIFPAYLNSVSSAQTGQG